MPFGLFFILPISKLKDWSTLIRVENTHAAGQSTATITMAHINVIRVLFNEIDVFH